MILLTDIATKLEQLLNGENNPVDFEFKVRVTGFHIDSIANTKTGKNQILVFIDSLGGDYNPVPDLEESNFNIQVAFYFPVRFKDDIYAMNEFLRDQFVGKMVNFGELSGSALCNLSVAQYGEIVGTDLDKFGVWVEETYGENSLYKNEIGVMENYMSMTLNIYTTQLSSAFIFGNNVSYSIVGILPEVIPNKVMVAVPSAHSITHSIYTRSPENDITLEDETQLYAWESSSETFRYSKVEKVVGREPLFTSTGTITVAFIDYVVDYSFENEERFEENLVWVNSGTGGSITPISQQKIGKDNYVKNIANLTQFNKSVTIFPKLLTEGEFWDRFINLYNIQRLDIIKEIRFVKTYNTSLGAKKFLIPQIILSINENVELGQPLSFTFTFGDGE